MSAPSSRPGQAPSVEDKPAQRSPGHSGWSLGRLLVTLALIISGFIVLFLGIAIGNATRKRVDHWAHGY